MPPIGRSRGEEYIIDPATFRDALARWPSGVAVVACRTDGRVVATTVSAFMSLSVQPPLVLIALGPNATVRPYLPAGAPFGISILAADQRRLASVFADPFPVGPDPFAQDGVPLIEGALVQLECTVADLHHGGAHVMLTAAVSAATVRSGAPLLRFDRAYHRLDP